MNDAPAENAQNTTQLSMDWKNNLPETVRGWDEVKNSDSPEKFFDQMANMRKMIGQSIRVPSQDAGPEQLEAFYKKIEAKAPDLMRKPNPEDPESLNAVMRALGMPEDETGYTYQGEASEAELADLRKMAKDIGLTKNQFEKLADGMLGANKAMQSQTAQIVEKERQALQKEWGAATDERYNEILNIAEATGASPAMLESIKNKTIDAQSAKWLYQMGKQLGGETVNAHVEQKTLAPSEASERIDDILNNRAHPYWDASHPDHQKAVEKVINLHRLAAG